VHGPTSLVRSIDAAEAPATATVTVTMKLPGSEERPAGAERETPRGVTLDVTVDVRELLARLAGAPGAAERATSALPAPDAPLVPEEPPTAARALVGRTVADVERELILETLQHCAGNRTHAAHVLGISIRTLRNKLHQYAIEGFSVPPVAGFGGG
jgi:two-component system response regulator FlrC